jgi:hypothetical protein
MVSMAEGKKNIRRKILIPIICASIVFLLIGGVFVGERIAYSMKFPKSSSEIELDGNLFWITTYYWAIWTAGWDIEFQVTLHTDTPINEDVSSKAELKSVWIIPKKEGFLAWRDSLQYTMLFLYEDDDSSVYKPHSSYLPILAWERVDVIVSLYYISNGQTYHLHQNGVSQQVAF